MQHACSLQQQIGNMKLILARSSRPTPLTFIAVSCNLLLAFHQKTRDGAEGYIL